MILVSLTAAALTKLLLLLVLLVTSMIIVVNHFDIGASSVLLIGSLWFKIGQTEVIDSARLSLLSYRSI